MPSRKVPAEVRGVYERDRGSGIWWIRYEVDGKPKREKVGRRSDAIALDQRRKADVRVGLKLPDNLRQRAVSLGQLELEAIQWYEDHAKRDLYTFTNRMKLIIRELGSRHRREILGYLILRILSVISGLYLAMAESSSLMTVALVVSPNVLLFGLIRFRVSRHIGHRHVLGERYQCVGYAKC